MHAVHPRPAGHPAKIFAYRLGVMNYAPGVLCYSGSAGAVAGIATRR